MAQAEFETDERGYPIMLATRAPGQVAPQQSTGVSARRDTRRGNPWFDKGSGQFSSSPNLKIIAGQELFAKLLNISRQIIQMYIAQFKPDAIGLYQEGNSIRVTLIRAGQPIAAFAVPSEDTPEEEVDIEQLENEAGIAGDVSPGQRSDVPPGVDVEAWERRLDAVRDLARAGDDLLNEDAVREFLEGRAKDVTSVDIEQFIEDAKSQRLDDLADALAIEKAPLLEGRSQVRVVTPRNWSKKTLQGLDDDDVLRVMQRLEARGFDQEDLEKTVLKKIKDESRRTKLEQEYGERQEAGGGES